MKSASERKPPHKALSRADRRLLVIATALALGACGERAQPSVDAAEHPAFLLADGGDDVAACARCHARDYEGARNHSGEKPLTCMICHRTTGWHPTQVLHGWPLTGAHEKTECSHCHGDFPGHYVDTGSACVDCHRADFDGARDPVHTDFPTTCESCHGTSAWRPSTRHHDAPSPADTGGATEAPDRDEAGPEPAGSPAAPRPAAVGHKPVKKPAKKPVKKPVPAPDSVPHTDSTTSASWRR